MLGCGNLMASNDIDCFLPRRTRNDNHHLTSDRALVICVSFFDEYAVAVPFLKGEIMKTRIYSILALVAAASIIAMSSVVCGGLGDTRAAVAGSDMSVAKRATGLRYAPTSRDTLAGLEAVTVSVRDLVPEAAKYGLTRQAFQTDTELRLRQHGVKVLTEQEFSKRQSAWARDKHRRTDAAVLYINVEPLIDEEAGGAAVGVRVQLQQWASLPREPKILYSRATTWEQEAVMLCGFRRIDEVRDQVRDLVDEFINDYLGAKAKEQLTQKETTLDKPDTQPADEKQLSKTTSQDKCSVSRKALADMHICALRYRAATEPNRPEEDKTNAYKMGELMLQLQAGYLQNLGLGRKEILGRYIYLIEQSARNDPVAFAACFDYLGQLQGTLETRRKTTDTEE